jgi:hypothetical protein
MNLKASAFKALGIQVASRFVGGMVSGPPTEGTWIAGDFVVDKTNGLIWICVEDGTPGKWRAVSQASLPGTGIVGPAILNGALLGNGEDVPGELIPRYCRWIVPRTGTLRDVGFMPILKTGNYNLIIRDCGAAVASVYKVLAESGSKEVSGEKVWQVWDPQLSVKRGQELMVAVVGTSATFKIAKASLTTPKLFELPSSKYLSASPVKPKLIGTTAKQAEILAPSELAEASLIESGVVPLITGVVEAP